MEKAIIAGMQQGNHGDFMLVSPQVRIWTEDRHPELNASQLRAVDEIFLAREKIVGLEGIAGTGKTTTLSVIREGAKSAGYYEDSRTGCPPAAGFAGKGGVDRNARGSEADLMAGR
jgi:hypothetical protein